MEPAGARHACSSRVCRHCASPIFLSQPQLGLAPSPRPLEKEALRIGIQLYWNTAVFQYTVWSTGLGGSPRNFLIRICF